MTLKQTLLLTLAAAAFIIGVHRTFTEGLYANYWLYMVSLVLLMLYRNNRKKEQEAEKEQQEKFDSAARSSAKVKKKR